MTATGHKGSLVVQSGTRIVFRVPVVDGGGKVTSGTAPTVKILELQADGSFKTFDFADNTFKTGTVTTLTASLSHQTANNGAYSTGVWTYALSTVTGFTRGAVYLAEIYHATGYPLGRWEEFTYGSDEGDAVAGDDVLWGTYTLTDLLKDIGASLFGDVVNGGGTYRLPGTSTTRMTVTNPAAYERTIARG